MNAGCAGGEARFWLHGRAPFSRPGRRAMVGPYLGARVELSRTGLRDHVRDRHAGTSVTVAEGLLFGYRFSFRRVVEVTPSLGVIVKTEWDPSGRLAAWTTGTAVVGLTAGVLF